MATSSIAKPLFLEGLVKLPGAKLTFGGAVSKAGLRRFVISIWSTVELKNCPEDTLHYRSVRRLVEEAVDGTFTSYSSVTHGSRD
ncbi:MAG: hypothetical protein KIS29_06480 [Thermoplasmata archaeon]|nr:hypothetical protein [Candidatus Sysuiplasma jiujiangense]